MQITLEILDEIAGGRSNLGWSDGARCVSDFIAPVRNCRSVILPCPLGSQRRVIALPGANFPLCLTFIMPCTVLERIASLI